MLPPRTCAQSCSRFPLILDVTLYWSASRAVDNGSTCRSLSTCVLQGLHCYKFMSSTATYFHNQWHHALQPSCLEICQLHINSDFDILPVLSTCIHACVFCCMLHSHTYDAVQGNKIFHEGNSAMKIAHIAMGNEQHPAASSSGFVEALCSRTKKLVYTITSCHKMPYGMMFSFLLR